MVNYMAKAAVMLESAIPGVFYGLHLGTRPRERGNWPVKE